MSREEIEKIKNNLRTMNARVYQLEITEIQKDILIEALALYDDKYDLDDTTYENLRDQLDNAPFLGDSV